MTDNSLDNPLASALGIVLSEDQAESDNEKKRAVAASLTPEAKQNVDGDFARETLYEMIQKSNEGIEELLTIAKQTSSARHFEVLAQLINGNATMAEKLVKINNDRLIIANNAINLERNKTGQSPGKTGASPTIGTAVFVGTTDQLLSMIRESQEKQVIEVESKPVDEE